MKIYTLSHTVDAFMDGRMENAMHMFSTLDKLFQFAEFNYGKKKEDFEHNKFSNTYSIKIYGEWDSEIWFVEEVILDKDLENLLELENEVDLNETEDITMEAIVYKHGEDDYGIWQLDLPQEAIDKIENILSEYAHRGCSVRGTMKEILEEMM